MVQSQVGWSYSDRSGDTKMSAVDHSAVQTEDGVARVAAFVVNARRLWVGLREIGRIKDQNDITAGVLPENRDFVAREVDTDLLHRIETRDVAFSKPLVRMRIENQ